MDAGTTALGSGGTDHNQSAARATQVIDQGTGEQYRGEQIGVQIAVPGVGDSGKAVISQRCDVGSRVVDQHIDGAHCDDLVACFPDLLRVGQIGGNRDDAAFANLGARLVQDFGASTEDHHPVDGGKGCRDLLANPSSPAGYHHKSICHRILPFP